MLEKFSHTCTIADSGREGLQRLESEEYDCILLDIQMPDMDGPELFRILRSPDWHGSNSTTPVIAMTAHALDKDKNTFLDMGMDGYLAKPIRMEDLRRCLAEMQA